MRLERPESSRPQSVCGSSSRNTIEFHGDPKIWKKWGKEKPSDWQSLQIPDASKQALWVSHAGVGSHVTVGILRKSW